MCCLLWYLFYQISLHNCKWMTVTISTSCPFPCNLKRSEWHCHHLYIAPNSQSVSLLVWGRDNTGNIFFCQTSVTEWLEEGKKKKSEEKDLTGDNWKSLIELWWCQTFPIIHYVSDGDTHVDISNKLIW